MLRELSIEHRRFHLRFGRERNVHGHLVAVKVSVKRGANHRMEVDSFSFDKHRLESLKTETVKRRRAVEQYGMFADNVFENVPNYGFLLFDHFLGLLDGGAVPLALRACDR